MTTDQARDKTNYKGTQNVWRLSFKRIKKEEKNHDNCWAAKTRHVGLLEIEKRKKENYHVGLLDIEKKKIKQLPCWAT